MFLLTQDVNFLGQIFGGLLVAGTNFGNLAFELPSLEDFMHRVRLKIVYLRLELL